MKAYRAAVEDYARDGVDYLFHNKGDEHALIILSNLFKNAKKQIRIAANKLCNDSVVNTKDYLDSMKVFLDRGNTKLSILVTEKPSIEDINSCETENCFYRMLFTHPAYAEGRIHIKEAGGQSFRDATEEKINFCTGDDKMFRLENNIMERTAVANFNDKSVTRKLIEAFDEVYPNQTKVELAPLFQ